MMMKMRVCERNWAWALYLGDAGEALGGRPVLGGLVFDHPLNLPTMTVGGLRPRNALVATSKWAVMRMTFGRVYAICSNCKLR